jgi:hypothetical protein
MTTSKSWANELSTSSLPHTLKLVNRLASTAEDATIRYTPAAHRIAIVWYRYTQYTQLYSRASIGPNATRQCTSKDPPRRSRLNVLYHPSSPSTHPEPQKCVANPRRKPAMHSRSHPLVKRQRQLTYSLEHPSPWKPAYGARMASLFILTRIGTLAPDWMDRIACGLTWRWLQVASRIVGWVVS